MGRVKQRTVHRQDGVATRRLLIDTAERMFAQEGVDSVSIRSVNAAAGLAPAGVHYHFGTKEALLEAVMSRRGAPVEQDLTAQFGRLLKRGARPVADDIVRAFALPMVKVIAADPVGGRYWFCILAQLVGSHDPRLGQTTVQTDALVFKVVARTFPDVDPSLRALAWHIATGAVIQMLSEFGIPRDRPWMSGPDSLDEYAGVLIDFVAEGLDGSLHRRRSTLRAL